MAANWSVSIRKACDRITSMQRFSGKPHRSSLQASEQRSARTDSLRYPGRRSSLRTWRSLCTCWSPPIGSIGQREIYVAFLESLAPATQPSTGAILSIGTS
jgi:hypothetical protein